MNTYSGTLAATQSYGVDINGNPCPPCPPDAMQEGNGYEDFTGMGSTRLEDIDLYSRSINVSNAVCDSNEPERPPNFRQKCTRRVEVPFTRKVKVPTRTTKILPTTVEIQVPVKKLVQVPSFKIVDETYTVFEEREAVREKEIWVKQIVPEKYMQKVPVQMTRQVKKPTQELREVEEMVSVQVPSTQCVEVDGFRIDDVEDTKVVEVEEFQEFEYIPHPTGHSELARTRELGRMPNSRLGRHIGTDTFDADAPDLAGLDLDSNAGPVYEHTAHQHMHVGQTSRGRPGSRRGLPDPTKPDFSKDNFTHSDHIRAAGKNLGLEPMDTQIIKKASTGLGLSVRNTHTRHSDGTGVAVTGVESGGRAALAGLLENDIITAVNGVPTLTVEEFAGALNKSGGELQLMFNRDGRQNTPAYIQR